MEFKRNFMSQTINVMDVFSLRNSVLGDYAKFAKSFTKIADKQISNEVTMIYERGEFWPEPMIQINPNYETKGTIEQVTADYGLHPKIPRIFQRNGKGLRLYRHQAEAIVKMKEILGSIPSDPEQPAGAYVVTTGTGSGKSLCFFIPMIDEILKQKEKDSRKRTRAIIIYPMNALANSQLEEVQGYLRNLPDAERAVSVAIYTGQEDRATRERVAESPPDILITNFMMLELLLTRQDETDRRVIGNCRDVQFLVLDELHTYRGRQGADVAMLIRRIRSTLSTGVVCVGTSATMASDVAVAGQDERLEKQKIVAQVASKLFGTSITPSHVIIETLERKTNRKRTKENLTREELIQAISQPIQLAITNAELEDHPLAIWVEMTLGIRKNPQNVLMRATPKTLRDAVRLLVEDSGCSKEQAEKALKDFLLTANKPEGGRGIPHGSSDAFFAFKLHQFFSGAGTVFSTLEEIGKRRVTSDAQVFLPDSGEMRLYGTYFCRECGHDYHPVFIKYAEGKQLIRDRDIDDVVPTDENDEGSDEVGFITLDRSTDEFQFKGDIEDYPESWVEVDRRGQQRIVASKKKKVAKVLLIDPKGEAGTGLRYWFLPGKFSFCLSCKWTAVGNARDRNRLASLSAEGRSSATTVMISSILKWMNDGDSGIEPHKRKLLGFTDNRQDASLQAGHFNDFIKVALVRAGFLGALSSAGSKGIPASGLGVAVSNALGFTLDQGHNRDEWMRNPEMMGARLEQVQGYLHDVLSYRVWFDQDQGWRFTNPNLAQLGFLRVEYDGLDDLLKDDRLFAKAPEILKEATAEVRERVFRHLLDSMREGLAVEDQALEYNALKDLKNKSTQNLLDPWGFGREEDPTAATFLVMSVPSGRIRSQADSARVIRSGQISTIGKRLRSGAIWGESKHQELRGTPYEELLEFSILALEKYGLIVSADTPFGDVRGYRVKSDCMTFFLKNPEGDSTKNPYFRSLYLNLAQTLTKAGHPLFGFEGREHTAQVDKDVRKLREGRFRFESKDQEAIKEMQEVANETGEGLEFLPVLFCSPTMELGVDISSMNVVYLRNIPPTPANYAQRSGRAGRSGQAALVLSYCAARSPHDQYFFKDPSQMVSGSVRAPTLELGNRELIDSHLQALWLAESKVPLKDSIGDILNTENQCRFHDEIRGQFNEAEIIEAVRPKMQAVLKQVEGFIKESQAYWYSNAEAYANQVARNGMASFDRAFSRWRDIYNASSSQDEHAYRLSRNMMIPIADRNRALERQRQALQQKEALLGLSHGSGGQNSEFSTYRYLATEGFLPGYNFPRLPLMAFIPSYNRGGAKRAAAVMQRPRFVGISEFGPYSLLYHEGRQYRVDRVNLGAPSVSGALGNSLPTYTIGICTSCGAGHPDRGVSNCHSCGISLEGATLVNKVFKITSVSTSPANRITADDEERTRQGFELRTTYEWARRSGRLDKSESRVTWKGHEIGLVQYGAAATISRLNLGQKRRKNKEQFGFLINPITGYWEKAENGDSEQVPTQQTAQTEMVVPAVDEIKNAFIFKPKFGEAPSPFTMSTLQYAFLRGIEAEFELEEGEIQVEPMPNPDARTAFLVYEAAEGGAGVLSQLIGTNALSRVAKRGLEIMHYDLKDGESDLKDDRLVDTDSGRCVAGCYRCLLSYFNQMEHENIDRRDALALSMLLRLASSEVSTPQADETPVAPEPEPPTPWEAAAILAGVPSWDPTPHMEGDQAFKYVWKEAYVLCLVDGKGAELRDSLEERGFTVVVFGSEMSKWDVQFAKLKRILGVAQ
jgi:Lhr-like helicase